MSERGLLLETAAALFDAQAGGDLSDRPRDLAGQELWSRVDELGFGSIGIGEEHGGAGGTLSDAVAVIAVAARAAAQLPLADALHAAMTLAGAGISLPPGRLTSARARPAELSVEQRANGWHVSGELRRVPWARDASNLVLVDPGAEQVLLVPLSACAVRNGSNLAGEPRDDVQIDALVHREQGSVSANPSSISSDWFALGALLRAAQIAGALEAILELTIDYVGQRHQFGRPLGTFQVVQHRVATLAGLVAAASLAAEAAAATPPGREREIAVAATKTYTSRACGECASTAHQLHGAIGITHEYRLGTLTRRIWAWRDEFGGELYWARNLGNHIQTAGADATWPLLADTKTTT
jgi:acyl-CoA dehydrogenase